MAVLNSNISRNSEADRANAAAHEALMAQVQGAIQTAADGGGQKSREQHLFCGKILPRDRVSPLHDPGSPFLEIDLLTAHDLYESASPYAAVVAGNGFISGRKVMIRYDDAAVKSGTYYPLTVKEQFQAQEITEQNHLPRVSLVNNDGANLDKRYSCTPTNQ